LEVPFGFGVTLTTLLKFLLGIGIEFEAAWRIKGYCCWNKEPTTPSGPLSAVIRRTEIVAYYHDEEK
jgi:hypothetical protein